MVISSQAACHSNSILASALPLVTYLGLPTFSPSLAWPSTRLPPSASKLVWASLVGAALILPSGSPPLAKEVACTGAVCVQEGAHWWSGIGSQIWGSCLVGWPDTAGPALPPPALSGPPHHGETMGETDKHTYTSFSIYS